MPEDDTYQSASSRGPFARRSGDVADDGTQVLQSKFDVGTSALEFHALPLPFCYGESRIAALVRSPDSLYLYWEITDEGIDAARDRLGHRGYYAWCCLRVYDSTGRNFDGVNAHGYFDIPVERGTREYFLQLERPASTWYVEIGMKSDEGFFQPIARSGRADFPRKGPSSNHSLEWMTVTSEGAPPAARPCTSKYKGPPPRAYAARGTSESAGRGGGTEGAWATTVDENRTYTWMHPIHTEVQWEGPWLFEEWRLSWRLHWLAGPAALPQESAAWVTGPFTLALADSGRIEVLFEGDGAMQVERHISGLEVFGPWQVVIKSYDTQPQRRILGTWRIHFARVEPTRVERWWTIIERRRVDAWQRVQFVGGASESRTLVEGGASETWRQGASERWMLGASEWFAAGGSEVMWMGASQLSFAGASALLYGGASERTWGGASGWGWGGASERLVGGASEHFGWGSSSHVAASAPLGWR